jgi:hypothetical protein
VKREGHEGRVDHDSTGTVSRSTTAHVDRPLERAAEKTPAPRHRMKSGQAVSMAICVAFGFAYFAWVAFTEGWRFWLVASLVLTFAALGFVAHRAMGVGRGPSPGP